MGEKVHVQDLTMDFGESGSSAPPDQSAGYLHASTDAHIHKVGISYSSLLLDI